VAIEVFGSVNIAQADT